MPLTFQILSTPDEIASVRAFCDAHFRNPNQDFAQFLEICRLRPDVDRPVMVVARRDGEISAVMMARAERSRLPMNLAYLQRHAPTTRTLTVLHAGLLGMWDEAAAEGLASFLPTLYRELRVNLIRFSWVREDHPVLDAVRAAVVPLWRDGIPDRQKHWLMSIPAAPGELLAKRLKSKHRGWIRKKTQELEKAHPGEVTWKSFRSGDVLAWFPELERVAALTYQRALGSGFADTPEFRWMFGNFSAQGCLRIYMLSIRKKAVGFWIGTVVHDTFHSMYTGYDPALRDYELGTQIFIRMVDSLAEEGVQHFDFGLGDALYKQRFGTESWHDVSISVFRPSVTGLFLHSLTSSCGMLRRIAEWTIARAGFVQKVKTAWRRRLQKKLPPGKDSDAPPPAGSTESPAEAASPGSAKPAPNPSTETPAPTA